MMKTIVLLISLAAVCSASRYASRDVTMDLFKSLLSLPQQLGRDLENPESPYDFKWDDCSGGKGVVQLKALDIKPDPIPLPGNITAMGSVVSTAAIASPIKAAVELYKKVGIWIKIPCIDNIGSCEYEDLCSFLPSSPCPELLQKYNLPCHCPFAAGNYTLPTSPIDINVGSLPSWLADGDYHGKAQLTDAEGKLLACMEVYISLTVG